VLRCCKTSVQRGPGTSERYWLRTAPAAITDHDPFGLELGEKTDEQTDVWCGEWHLICERLCDARSLARYRQRIGEASKACRVVLGRVPHGMTSALMLPVVLGFNWAVNVERQAPYAQALRVATAAPDHFFVRINRPPKRDPVEAMAILDDAFHDVRKKTG